MGGGVGKHKVKGGKSHWHHIKNTTEPSIHRKRLLWQRKGADGAGLGGLKASKTVSRMLDAAVGARGGPRGKGPSPQPHSEGKTSKTKASGGNGKVLSSQALLSPKSFLQTLSLGPPSSVRRKHLHGAGRAPVIELRGEPGGHQSPWDNGDADPIGTRDPTALPCTRQRYLVRGCGAR